MEECAKGNWKPLKLSRDGPPISHLFFADDLVLFAEAGTDQVELIRDCLRRLCLASGHKVNPSQSKVFCSANVHFNRARELSQCLGIGITADLGN